MKNNMGNIDRIIRVVLAAVVSFLYFTGKVSGTGGFVLLIAGGILMFTAFLNFCPLYALLGIKTCKVKKP